MSNQGVHPSPGPLLGEHTEGILLRFAQLLFQLTITGSLLFFCAGSGRWWPGWLYLGAFVVSIAGTAGWVLPRNPEVIVARGKWHPDTARYEKVLLPIYTLCNGAIVVVAALGARFGWAALSPAWSIAGALLMLASSVPVAAAMGVNRNLEPTMRIQRERGHQVATSGPYRVVRHPMYAASLVQLPAIALTLGSAWALLPALAGIACVVVRTALEDRALRAGLPGYEAYTQRTRHRLIPGVW
jgi:protein-S-isoprenylcysteine O-methyltransferase Ste14